MGISSALSGAVGFVPAGVVVPFAGSSAPANWLLCDGSAVSRSDYGQLFAAIGTTYGSGNGSTTFNLPDMRGRIPAGRDNMGGSAASRLTTGGSSVDGATLGATGGSENVTLTSAQSGVPAHSHANSLTGTTTFANTGHTHTHIAPVGLNSGNIFVLNPTDGNLDGRGSYNFWDVQYAGGNFVGSSAAWFERYTVTSDGPSATASVGLSNANNSASNASSAHTNTQPTIILNYIIKA